MWTTLDIRAIETQPKLCSWIFRLCQGVFEKRCLEVNARCLDHQDGRRKMLSPHFDHSKIRINDVSSTADEPVRLHILMEDFGLQQQSVPEQPLQSDRRWPTDVHEQDEDTISEDPADDSDDDSDLEDTLRAEFQQVPGSPSCSTPFQHQRPLRSMRLAKKLKSYIWY